MKVLIIGGMHGNEPLGIELVKLFEQKPSENVKAVCGNTQAIEKNCRFVLEDLNRSFPGNQESEIYEQRRAAELLRICPQYDVVLDFHNTHCPDNDCCFVGQGSSPILENVAETLELRRMIIADYDCINKYAPNCLSVEISLDSPVRDSEIWYKKIVALSKMDRFVSTPKLEKYKFVYRLTLDDKEKFGLADMDLKAFQPIDENLSKALKISPPAYPIFIGDGYTPYNYGGILNKIR